MKSFNKFLRGLAMLMVAGSCVATSEAQTPPVRIMPLGDSLTSGVSNVTVPGAYRNRLYTLLTNAGYNVDFVGTKTDASNPTLPDKDHQGNGGSRIEELDANLGGWLNSVEDPDIILLLAGTNDFSQNFNLGSAQTRLANLIANAATKRPFAKIIVSSLPLRTDSASLEAQQVAFNAAIPGIVNNQVSLGRAVSYVDMHAAWTAADLDDGVHPTQAGYNKMADVWLPGITNAITPLGTLGTAPAITRTGPPTDLTHLTVRFSKPLADTAANVANYSLNGGLTVSAASLDAATKRIVTLTTSAQTPGTLYTLAVSNVKDRTAQQNTIAPGSTVAFSTDAQSNGSFELDFTGWSRTGNLEIKDAAPYTPTNGTKLVAFNAGQMTPNAVLTQNFATTPGVSYILTFDFGALGANQPQKLQLNVAGATMLINQQLSINGPGSSTSKWTSQSFAFLANSTTTQMSFGDASTVTNGVDMLLDNVKLTAQVPRTLTVSSAPTIGVPVTITPNDLNGNGGAPTGFSRQYLGGTTVTLVAPSTNGLNVFSKWQRNGVDFSNTTTATVTLDADYTMNAVYTNSNQVLVNGSFETGTFSPWAVSGGTVGTSAKINGVIVGTNGTKIVEFNSGNSPSGGVITQTFNTQVGATYTLAFDQGVLAYNTNQLKFLVTVTGNNTTLLSQTSTVNGVGNGTVRWFPKSYTFVANSTTSTLTFTDTSTAISAADLLLDNVTVTGPPVIPVNNAPVAVNDSYTTNQGVALVVPAATGVLANDTDTESNPLTAAVVVAPANGSVTLATNGGFTYTPTSGFSGSDSFTYRANDGNSNSNIATVSITVNPVSVAGIVNGSFEQGSPAALGPVTGWTQNATWPTTGAPAGHVPDASYPVNVPDGVRLLIFNAGGDVFTGSISQVFSTTPGQTYTLSLNAGVFSAGVTGKKQRLAVGITGGSPLVTTVEELTSASGTAALLPKSYTFVADSATTTLTLADATSGVSPSSARTGSDLLVDKVSIALSGPNTPPVAVADSYSTNQNVPLVIAAAGVLDNDTDAESDPLTAALVAGPANGTLNLAANGGFTYTPNTGFNGSDSFTYRANDGSANSNVVTVSLTVNAVSVQTLVNGSFEQGTPAALGTLTGWTQSAVWPTAGAPFGHVPDSNYPATVAEGVRLLVFNGGGNNFGGTVSQQFNTVVGEEYTLTLNAGVFSSGTAGKKQRLQITVTGNTELLSRSETLTSTTGTAALAPFSYTFTADSTSTTLLLGDTSGGVSPNTGADLLVDNVKIEGGSGPVNTAPAAVADTYSTQPNTALVVPAATGVLANDTDAESNALTAILNVGPSSGTLTLNANGGFTYTPNNGFNGTDSFTYHANDGNLDSNVVTVSITVAAQATQLLVNGSFESDYNGWTTTGNQAVQPTSTGYGATHGSKVATFNGANAAPNAVLSQSFATVSGATYTLEFDAGVYSFNTNAQKLKVDVDGTSSLFSQVLTLNGLNNGTSRFFAQSFSFVANSTLTTLTFRDQSATTAGLDMLLDNVRVTGLPGTPNTPPVAVADSYTTNQQTALVIAAPGLLANDTDAESTPLTAAVVAQPSNGTVTVAANGGFTYTPATGFFGSDSFTYRASDGVATSNVATVSITVNQVSIGGLANGSFEAGAASWIITGNHVIVDSAAPYTAFHGTKLLVMNGGNTVPNAVVAQTFTTTPGTEYTLSFNSGIMAASIQQRLQVAVTGSSSLVSETIVLTGNSAGNSVWTPRSYVFTANSATTTLTFTDVSTTSVGGDLLLDNVAVTAAGGPSNTAPAAVADSYTATQNTPLVVPAATGVLANDSDAESNPLTAALNVGPTSGTLTLNPNGSFTYTPNNGFSGSDSFTYHANDGTLDSNIVTVSITVNSSGIGAFANGSFEAGTLANYTISSWTQSGTFPAAGAPLGYVPDGTYPVTVPDGTRLLVFNGGSNVYTGNVSQQFATVPGNTYSLNLNAGVFSNGTAGKKQRLLINVAGSATLLAAFEDLTSTTGTAALGLRNYTFVADSAVTTLTLADGSSAVTASLAAGSDLLVDNVTINSVNLSANAPVAFADTYSTVQDIALVVPAAGVLANDTDADSDPLTASIVASPVHGTVNLAANGSFTYTPTLGYNGSDSFTYRANDGGRNSNIATVTITVTAPVATGLVNGSFESGLFAWTESGGTEYSVNLNTSYTGTDGTTLVEFNAANSVNGGTISQTFNTTPGTVYNLTFDLGVIAFNTNQQKLQVTVNGNGGSTLLSQVATINGVNGGTVKWEAKSYSFTADSAQTTLTLKDVSTVTVNIDMLLDNVKANPPGTGTPPSATNLVVNPSFETGVFTPWVTTGGTSASITSTLIPTNGTKCVEFNGSNTATGGSVSQTFTTTPGISYTLQFDLGVLAYNTFQQAMKVDVTGTGSLLSQTTTITGANNGTTKWEARSYTFTADSPSTTLKFTDVSTTGSGIDMLLDYVRVTSNGVPAGNSAPTAVVDNYSTTQNTPLTIAAPGVLSNDVDLQSNPMTAILVTGPASGTLNLAANGGFTYTPATGFTGSTTFTYKANDGLLDSTPVTVTISVNAVGALVNGSFENGLTAWTKAGGTADSVKANSIITGTNGSTLVEFNSAQSPAGGSLSQTFSTVAGQSYILNFDLGVLAYNTNAVTMNVKLVGSSQLVSQNFALNGVGSGTVKFVTQTLNFTANSASTTLTFTDATANTNSLDMLLDYVRLTSANARTLTLDSVVASNVALTITPSDNNGAGNGNTLLSRVYNLGTTVNVTAPGTSASGATFSKWVKDGVDFATTAATSVTISANTNLVAVYSGGTNPPLGNNIVVNGSFESLNGAGWANSWANVSSVQAATRIEQPGSASGFPSHGNNILSFNVGGEPNLGVVEQALNTVAGTTYTLRLDVGVYGGPTGAAIPQTLNIAAVGTSTVLSKSVTVQGTTSTFVWAPQTFTFTANSASTILRFSDGSSTGNGTDLFVDNVRVQSGTLAPSILTVNTTPDPGKAITVTPVDLAGQGSSTSNFTRAYATGSTVQLVAPHTNFVKWLKNGQWYATNQSITVVVDASITMTAVYTTPPVLGPFINGSFEDEFTGWTWTGSQQSVKVKDGLPSTHGLIVVEFNSNNSGLDGAISQTFTTTVGTTYNVAFDIGTKAFNTSQQKLRATVVGNNVTLVNQVFTINGIGNGDVVYAGKSFTFTANSATTTLNFADNSSTGAGLDLLLDNVRVTAATPGKTVNSPGAVVDAAPETTPVAAPGSVSQSEIPSITVSEPSLTIEVIGGTKYLVLTVQKPTIPDGVKRVVEVSPDLLEWFSGKNHTTVLEDSATVLKVRDNTPVTVDSKRYIRLKTTH